MTTPKGLGGQGQKPADESTSVVFASDAPAIPVTATTDPAAASGAKQDTGNTNLASIDTKIGAAVSGDGQAAGTIGSLFARLLLWNGATYDRARTAVTTVSSIITGFLNTLPWALYHLTPVTRTDGQGGPIETDALGNLRVVEQNAPMYENNVDSVASTHERPAASSTYNAIAYDTVTKANTGCIKAGPGNLYRAYFTNTNAAAQVIGIFNKASNPGGDTALFFIYVPGASTYLLEFKFGKRFTVGIAWAQVAAVIATAVTLAGTSDIVVTVEVS